MVDFITQISRLDETLAQKNGIDVPTSIALALRCWQAYRFFEPSQENRIHIQRANYTVIAAHRRNLAHLDLYTLTIFIAIEAGHYDSANEMLDKAIGYRNYLRANEPYHYGVLCFLYAYLELHQKRTRSARKHWRALTDHIKNLRPIPFHQIMQGMLHLAGGEYAEASNYFTEAFRAGSDSVFLYEGLYRCYVNADRPPEGSTILPVLTYAASRGADISELVNKFSEAISAAIEANPAAGEKLYHISQYPPLLKDICAHLISAGDLSDEAYALYKEAERKQMFAKGLFRALVESAYLNGIERVNRFPMSQFLSGSEVMDQGLSVYVYHLLLTDPALSDLLPDRQSKILQLGAKCLEMGVQSREVNSIYFYFWSRCKALGITGVDVEKAEKILKDNITFFELSAKVNSNVRFVYITEPEKRGMAEYEMPGDGTPIIIEAVSEHAVCTCLGAGKRAILDEKMTAKPMVAGAGAELYQYFFQKGDRRFHLLAYLANHYLGMDETPDEATPVFEALLTTRGITKSYRNRILVALGRLHYNAFSFDQALECYGAVDDDALGNEFIEQILQVYIETREYARAAKLVAAKSKFINGETLFEAVKVLLAKSEERDNIASVGYELITDGFYDDDILTLVLEYYPASYTEWSNLARLLSEDNRSSLPLDERIIETALWMAMFDTNSQSSFTRLYVARNELSSARSEGLISGFINLAMYEMLANSARPEYDVLSILEKWFVDNDDNMFLAWALGTVYLRHSVTTFKSEEILQSAVISMENENILLPVFKEPKPALSPYIEKFQPFLYRGLPDKDCWLYYRMDGEASFSAMRMRYVRYGLYAAVLPLFFNESVTYYFAEEMSSGSITTKESVVKNITPFLNDNSSDPFFIINNAIVYEQMFKHDRVEEIISRLVKDAEPVRSRLI